MKAYVIERRDLPNTRLIVVESRFGGHSFHLEEAEELVIELVEALARAKDPAPLPEAEPNLVHQQRTVERAKANDLIDLLGD